MQTMTNAQMRWLITRGLAWFETGADGMPNDDWRMPIWTRAGGWLWNNGAEQRYELLM